MDKKSIQEILLNYDYYNLSKKLKHFEEVSQHVFKTGRNITCMKTYQYLDDDCGTSRGVGPHWWEVKSSMTEKEKKAADLYNNFIFRFIKEADLLEKELLIIKNES